VNQKAANLVRPPTRATREYQPANRRELHFTRRPRFTSCPLSGAVPFEPTFEAQELSSLDIPSAISTQKLTDRRRKRPVGCRSRGQITRTAQLPSAAAVHPALPLADTSLSQMVIYSNLQSTPCAWLSGLLNCPCGRLAVSLRLREIHLPHLHCLGDSAAQARPGDHTWTSANSWHPPDSRAGTQRGLPCLGRSEEHFAESRGTARFAFAG